MKARADAAAIYRVADRLEPRVRAQFLDALAQLKGNVDEPALAAALEQQDVLAAERAIGLDALPDALKPMGETLRQILHGSGEVAAQELGAVLNQTLRFDLTNPHAVSFASRLGSQLIARIGEATRTGVQSLIANGIAGGRTVDATAREIRNLVGLTERQANAVANYRADLEAAGQGGDILSRRVARYGDQLLNQRARLIARTETISASAHGQLELWRQAAADGLIDPAKTKRRWSAAEDDRTCPICLALDGVTVPFGQPFKTDAGVELWASPAHPGCRCAQTLEFTASVMSTKNPHRMLVMQCRVALLEMAGLLMSKPEAVETIGYIDAVDEREQTPVQLGAHV